MAHFEFREGQAAMDAAHEYSCARLLAVGRLVEKKGFSVLLEALALLRRGVEFRALQGEPGFSWKPHLTIIGEGPRRTQLEQQIARLRLGGQVRLAGALSHEETMRTMRDAHCLVMPSLRARDGDRDGLPNVVLEAAALGLPLVAARTGGIGDFIDETIGVLCEAGEVRALARAICQVFNEPEAQHRRTLAARRRVVESFDIDRNIEPLLQAFAAHASSSS